MNVCLFFVCVSGEGAWGLQVKVVWRRPRARRAAHRIRTCLRAPQLEWGARLGCPLRASAATLEDKRRYQVDLKLRLAAAAEGKKAR